MEENKRLSKKQILVNYLLSEINKGNLKYGDQIPSELELTKQFKFGRQTVHNALSDLALQGIIVRTPGKGSFVSGPSVNRNIKKKKSFTEDMQSIGMEPGSSLLEFRVVLAKDYPEIANDLHIGNSEKLYMIVRLRTGNGIPIALQYTYIPTKYIEHFDLSATEKSLNEYTASIGYEVIGFMTKLRAVEATEDQRTILKTKSRAVLNSISIQYIKSNQPLSYTSSFYCSDRYEYTFSSLN